MPSVNEQELFSKLDELGEDEVRIRLAKGVFGDWKVPLVELWLLRKTEARTALEADRAERAAARAEVSADEERRLNRSAHKAAWIAAIAAIIAAIWPIIDKLLIK